MTPLFFRRFLTYFTVLTYLMVGTVAVRILSSEEVVIDFNSSYLNVFFETSSKSNIASIAVNEPQFHFEPFEVPVEKKSIEIKKEKVAAFKSKNEELPQITIKGKNELPFHEPIQLSKINFENELTANFLVSYVDFSYAEMTVAKKDTVITDDVHTKQASSKEVAKVENPVEEPEFFEYPKEVINSEDSPKSVEIENDRSIEPEENKSLLANEEVKQNEYSKFENSKNETLSNKSKTKALEVVPVNDLIAFDYSQANADIVTKKIPQTTKLTSHKNKPKSVSVSSQASLLNEPSPKSMITQNEEKIVPVKNTYYASLSIKAVGTDLKSMTDLQGFEIRFQDDLAEIANDYGSGEVKLESNLSQPKMTRSLAVVKRGYAPTSTEVIIEEGSATSSIPMVEEEVFNEHQQPYEANGIVGALLVELDDETELAKVDVSFGEVIKLDGDLRPTEGEDFRYQLFVGVQAGNSLLSYHRANGEVVSKIVHIHENEITYDANYYEEVVNEKVRIYEEDLLAKENSPLVISGENVKIFATNTSAKKVNDHTYKLNFGASNLGGRRYLELSHQDEPLFVGIRENNHVNVPSENFMRFILSNIQGNKLGNRCLIQINLDKKIDKYEFAAESVASSLMTHAQVLDKDGKFYDSPSEKSEKIIIIGESQGSQEISPDAKINVKINYMDGSVQYLNSYCSPNTYLVEQL